MSTPVMLRDTTATHTTVRVSALEVLESEVGV